MRDEPRHSLTNESGPGWFFLSGRRRQGRRLEKFVGKFNNCLNYIEVKLMVARHIIRLSSGLYHNFPVDNLMIVFR